MFGVCGVWYCLCDLKTPCWCLGWHAHDYLRELRLWNWMRAHLSGQVRARAWRPAHSRWRVASGRWKWKLTRVWLWLSWPSQFGQSARAIHVPFLHKLNFLAKSPYFEFKTAPEAFVGTDRGHPFQTAPSSIHTLRWRIFELSMHIDACSLLVEQNLRQKSFKAC